MTTTINDTDKRRLTMGSHDSLSKQGARAVLFVLLLAFLMALSAIFLILGNNGSGTAAAVRRPDTQACLDWSVGGGSLPQKRAEASRPVQQEHRSPA
jgi:hypothetical protein